MQLPLTQETLDVMHTSWQAALNAGECCLVICPPISGRDYRLQAFQEWQKTQKKPVAQLMHLDIDLIDQASDVSSWLELHAGPVAVMPVEDFIQKEKIAALNQLLRLQREKEFGLLLFHEGFPSDFSFLSHSAFMTIVQRIYNFALFSESDSNQFLSYWEERNAFLFEPPSLKKQIFQETGGHTWLMTEIQRQYAEGSKNLETIINSGNYSFRAQTIIKLLPPAHRQTLDYLLHETNMLSVNPDVLKELIEIKLVSNELDDRVPSFVKRFFQLKQKVLALKDSHFLLGENNVDSVFTKLEKKALEHILSHQNTLITKDELIEKVWPETVVSDWALEQLLHRLRRKILKLTGKATLKTIKNQGYIYV